MRSALAAGGVSPRPANMREGSTALMRNRAIACMARLLERQDVEEEAREPAGLLVLGDRAAAAVLDARVGDLRGLHGVQRGQVDRVHDARKADVFRALV